MKTCKDATEPTAPTALPKDIVDFLLSVRDETCSIRSRPTSDADGQLAILQERAAELLSNHGLFTCKICSTPHFVGQQGLCLTCGIPVAK